MIGKNAIFMTIGASNHTAQERDVNDYYATEPKAVDKLLTVETPSKLIWECACGEGHLSRRLTEYGYKVYSSDKIDRGYGEVLDFLTVDKENAIQDCDILTNPPYSNALEFVLKALDLVSPGHKVYMFLKLTFLEGKQRAKELYKEFPPQKVYVCTDRILCAKSGRFDLYHNKTIAYAWYVWEKGKQQKTEVGWV